MWFWLKLLGYALFLNSIVILILLKAEKLCSSFVLVCHITFFKKIIYLFERVRERAHARTVGSSGAEGEVDSSLSREPNVGLNPRTPRSWPESKVDALPTEPPTCPCCMTSDEILFQRLDERLFQILCGTMGGIFLKALHAFHSQNGFQVQKLKPRWPVGSSIRYWTKLKRDLSFNYKNEKF